MGERQCLCDKCRLGRLSAEVERLRERVAQYAEALLITCDGSDGAVAAMREAERRLRGPREVERDG